MKPIFSWYRKVYRRYHCEILHFVQDRPSPSLKAEDENCIRSLPKAIFLKRKYFCLGVVILLSLAVRKVEYTGASFRDPFQSPFESDEGLTTITGRTDLSNLEVQGMVWGSSTPQAIINNQVVKVGEVVDGAQVLDIRKEGVYILYEGTQYILRPTLSEQEEK